jgi:hypothetical protein
MISARVASQHLLGSWRREASGTGHEVGRISPPSKIFHFLKIFC